MYTIAKTFQFSAAHHLPNVPRDHPCARNHGHNYKVTVMLGSEELDHRGFVVDYRDLGAIKDWLDLTLDHRDLNDVMDNPTAELLAKFIYGIWRIPFPQLAGVRVSETDATWAVFSPEFHR